jgi:hypothetical protein
VPIQHSGCALDSAGFVSPVSGSVDVGRGSCVGLEEACTAAGCRPEGTLKTASVQGIAQRSNRATV